MGSATPSASLVAEAARRSRVCWLSYASPGSGGPQAVRDRLVWHVWHDDALVVLSCPGGTDGAPGGEQLVPGLGDADRVEVTMRSKDTGGRLVTWCGTVEVVDPAAPSWADHLEALLAARLNLPDPAAARRHWTERGTVVRIRPVLDAAEATGNEGLGALPSSS